MNPLDAPPAARSPAPGGAQPPRAPAPPDLDAPAGVTRLPPTASRQADIDLTPAAPASGPPAAHTATVLGFPPTTPPTGPQRPAFALPPVHPPYNPEDPRENDPRVRAARQRAAFAMANPPPGQCYWKGRHVLDAYMPDLLATERHRLVMGFGPSPDGIVKAAFDEVYADERRAVREAEAAPFDRPATPACRVCQHPERKALEQALHDANTPDLITLADLYDLQPSQVALHVARCLTNLPILRASTDAAERRASALERFGIELLDGVRRGLEKAEAILETQPDSIETAKAHISLSKARASILDGALARAERKRLLDALEAPQRPAEALGGPSAVVPLHPRSQRLADALARRSDPRQDPDPIDITPDPLA